MRKLTVTMLMVLIASVAWVFTASAASVGEQLLQPEEGWKRIDSNHESLDYVGSWREFNHSGNYNRSKMYSNSSNNTDYIKFQFNGTSLRIISERWSTYSDNIQISIDGENYSYSQYGSNQYQTILFEKQDLSDNVHTVEIKRLSGKSYFSLDAIDIDENGTMIDNTLEPPANLSATASDSRVDLIWDSVTEANSYNVYRSTTQGGPYSLLAPSVTDVTYYSDASVVNDTTYYYVVSASYDEGESPYSVEVSATPQGTGEPVDPIDPSNGRAILTITMLNGKQLEYDLSSEEVDSFLAWYNTTAQGNGLGYYSFSDNSSDGPFTNRTDYIVFDKILMFELDEYVLLQVAS